MKIGYPCINRTLDCTSSSTFRLKSYSVENLIKKVEDNLNCLEKILKFNIENDMLFFRISSDLVPFASHQVNDCDWGDHFLDKFKEIGDIIKENDIRISMHPDQFIVLNSNKEDVYHRSVDELLYHAEVLDLLGLNNTAKIQLHVGGVYGNKEKSKKRFIDRYQELDEIIKKRLVIENDERSYSVKDCLDISEECGVPVLFDHLHHSLKNNDEELNLILKEVEKTWKEQDGIPMVDYSSQMIGEREGRHAESIDKKDFLRFIERSKPHDFDLMLEIKDKEKSAVKAVDLVSDDPRFIPAQI
ncbi:MAG: UV DNA damage repair endonuclease UvsE [Candidatus Saliniplasma sp.]